MIHLLLGQTATGKTAAAVQLARELGGEIVSCDSRQVYRHLDIITGKYDNPRDIPVHMVDVVDPHDRYSSYAYTLTARSIVRDILARGQTPIIIGGTGLYAYHLLHLDVSRPDVDIEVPDMSRDELERQIMAHDHQALTRLNASDRANPRRLSRLLQKLLSGDTESRLSPTRLLEPAEHIDIQLYLHRDQGAVQERIRARVLSRLADGAVSECQRLLAMGYRSTDPGLATLGYQDILRHLAGEISLDAAVELWVTHEVQYAKRQRTYLMKYFAQAAVVEVGESKADS